MRFPNLLSERIAMRVLLVEDSKKLRHYVGKALKQAGFAVDVAADGEDGQWLAESNQYDVIILDIMMPKRDGITVLQNLRSAGNGVHIILLTAKDTVADRVHGLEQGADDYLVKPFAMEEFVARVQVLARRGYQEKSPRIEIGELAIDTAERTVRKNGSLIDLPPRDFSLLEYLAVRRGTVVSRNEIEQHIYDDKVEPMSNVVDAAIYSLRKKIDTLDQLSLIRTRRGMGYIIDGEEN